MGCGPEALLKDREVFGLLFEGMAVRDLRVHASAMGGCLYHYRDDTGLEADAVIQLPDGRWALVEVKLFSSAGIEEGAANLKRLAAKVDQTSMGAPAFMMVLTATARAGLRKDGVHVVPITMLGP